MRNFKKIYPIWGQLHYASIVGELNLGTRERDELQDRVQELAADVSRLEAELKSRTEALQKESSEKNTLVVEHDRFANSSTKN